jgi:serine/threonine-protein kinase
MDPHGPNPESRTPHPREAASSDNGAHSSLLPQTGPYETTPPDAGGHPLATIHEDVVPSRPRPVSGQIGPYELIEEVAHGGMGIIYKARHTTLDRIVALKTMRGDARLEPEQARRFDREMLAGANLDHANIVAIYDANTHLGQPYYTMPFIAGGSLAQHRARFTADPRVAVAVVEKVARAIHYAHEEGIVHRDLKPSNILLDGDEPKVSDFGLAKVTDSDVELTRSGAVMGTPAYMAPEQAAGSTHLIGPATDVWALGVILYEMLTGRRPFLGSTSEEIQKQLLRADPPRPRSLRPGLDRALETVVLHCLRNQPDRRYPSAQALADDLACWLRDEPISAKPDSFPRRAHRAFRRHRVLVFAAGVVGLLLAAVIVVQRYTDPDRPLQASQAQLRSRQPVTLIGNAGPPAWFRMGLGGAILLKSPRQAEPFSFESLEPACLVELLPALPIDHYRFRAQVLHDSTAGNSEVGIYFGHSSHPHEHGLEHCFCTLTFDDWENKVALNPQRPDRTSEVGLRLWRCCPEGKSCGFLTCGISKPFPGTQAQGADPPQWRHLAIEVSPTAFKFSWQGECFGEISRERLMRTFTSLRKTRPGGLAIDLDPQFLPQDALGLFVRRGKAQFRNVVVEPLP